MESHAQQHGDGSGEAEVHLVPYRVYLGIWAALMALTAITIGVKYADLGHLAVFTAVLIASVKCTLVVLYFMHVRFERPLIGVMIAAAFITFAIYICLTFSDYSFR